MNGEREELALREYRDEEIAAFLEMDQMDEEAQIIRAVVETQERLRAFERRCNLSTQEFIERFMADELEESLDFAEWVGEQRMLERLAEKLAVLRGTSITG